MTTTRSPWILSPYWDISLFIASPLLVIAVFTPLRLLTGSQNLSLLLLAFFTFGHHLPGFLRSYGDRELFERYRWRFLLAPPLVFGATFLFDFHGLHGLLLLVFLWDIWHVTMQNYGFLRLYDARLGLGEANMAWLDRAVSISWYVTFVLASPHYLHDLLYRLFSSGVPIFPGAVPRAALFACSAISVALSAWYVIHTIRRPRNWYKLATLGCFLFATWYLYVYLDDFVAGFAIWSAYHCLQYFGIVWAWNQKRPQMAPWARVWFRPRVAWLFGYLALIFLYGAINYGAKAVEGAAASRYLLSFIIASGTLHYYYDAFIWKLRPPGRQPGWRSAGIAQAAVFASGLAVFAWLESAGAAPEAGIRQALVRLSPHAAISHLNWGEQLRAGGRWEEAAQEYAAAYERDASLTLARERAGLLYSRIAVDALRGGDREKARRLFARVAAASPLDAGARVNLANVLMMDGRATEAEREFRLALGADPNHAMAHGNLGVLLVRSGRRAEAEEHLRFALRHGDEAVRRVARQIMAVH